MSEAGAAEIQFKDSGTSFYVDYKNARVRRVIDNSEKKGVFWGGMEDE